VRASLQHFDATAFMTHSFALSVLEFLTDYLHEKGYHVLRYNSRGNGASTGWPSFSGLNEGKDLEAMVQWALQTADVPIESLVLIVSCMPAQLPPPLIN
jgi:uncharacterized protein